MTVWLTMLIRSEIRVEMRKENVECRSMGDGRREDIRRTMELLR